MTVQSIGFLALHECDYAAAAVAASLVRFLDSPTWGVRLRHYASIAAAGSRTPRRPGVIRAAERDTVFVAMIAAPTNSEVSMASESLLQSTDERAELTVRRPGVVERFSQVRGVKPTRDAAVDNAWIAAAIALFDVLSASTGVLLISDSQSVTSETSGVGIRTSSGYHHPWPDEFARMRGLATRELGTRYMRFPRWGTLVSHDHIGQLGGVAAIARAVEPAVVRSLAGGVYFQLTATVASAMSDEAAAKQAAFTTFAAPLLPPPVTPPGGET